MANTADKLTHPRTTEDSTINEQDLAVRLRSDIVNNVFSPGERLKFAALSSRYASGHGSLREALAQLVTEGFVTQEINKGFSVAPVSRHELTEVAELYIELEQRALVSAITHGDDTWEANIVACHHKLRAIEKLDWNERVTLHSKWVVRHRDFHTSLVAACDGMWLLKLRTVMFDQLDRYRYLTKISPKATKKGRGSEHRKLMEAVLDRDAESASAILKLHIEKTSEGASLLLQCQE